VGMANPRKGGQFLLPAVSKIMALMDSIIPQIYVFGGSQGSLQMHDGVSIKNLGHLSDNISLSLIYSAADVFLAPSLYDNLPNTVLESLACGTPVVGFNIGGLPDVITHQVNGYLATPYSVDDISYGLTWALTRDFTNQSEEIRRNLMKICDPHSVAASYKSLYESFVK